MPKRLFLQENYWCNQEHSKYFPFCQLHKHDSISKRNALSFLLANGNDSQLRTRFTTLFSKYKITFLKSASYGIVYLPPIFSFHIWGKSLTKYLFVIPFSHWPVICCEKSVKKDGEILGWGDSVTGRRCDWETEWGCDFVTGEQGEGERWWPWDPVRGKRS